MTPTTPHRLPEELVAYIRQCRTEPRGESRLIAVLQRVQQHFGYLSPEALDQVSQLMQIPAARVTGVATFYHFFNFTPKGQHRITVCLGTACYVRGAAKVQDRFKELLGLPEGGVTKDGRFSLEPARCLGACALAPVVVVNEKVYGNVTPADVEKILAEYGFSARRD